LSLLHSEQVRQLRTAKTFRPSLLHRMWRLLPPRQRRQMMSEVAAVFAPRIDHAALGAQAGVAVLGDLTRPSGLGEGARLMSRALESLHLPTWARDNGPYLPVAYRTARVIDQPEPPAGVPLVIHVNAPLLPLVRLRVPRTLMRGRRVAS
jgi:hypothetical protein